jgi:hypothetical protein
MFWACFTWDSKGPSHIWITETAQEKKQAEIELVKLKALLEPKLTLEWELTRGVKRMKIRRRPGGRKPQWRFSEKNGKLVQQGKAGGIDWYRYWQQILLSKLIPYAKKCPKTRPNTLV